MQDWTATWRDGATKNKKEGKDGKDTKKLIGTSDMVKHELRVTSCELRVTSYELKS